LQRPKGGSKKSREMAVGQLPWDKTACQPAVPSPGTEFLDAGTEPPKSPPETTNSGRDQNVPERVAEIPAQTAYLRPTGKYSVRRDWLVETRWIETGCPPLNLSNESPVGARNGNFRCRNRATKPAILARIQQQRLRKPQNQGRMSL